MRKQGKVVVPRIKKATSLAVMVGQNSGQQLFLVDANGNVAREPVMLWQDNIELSVEEDPVAVEATELPSVLQDLPQLLMLEDGSADTLFVKERYPPSRSGATTRR